MVGIKDPSCMMYALEIDDMLYTTRDLGLLSYLSLSASKVGRC